VQIPAVECSKQLRRLRPDVANALFEGLMSAVLNLSLIHFPPRRSAEKNFALAQLLRIDPLSIAAYSHFTSHLKNQPRAAAIGRITFGANAWHRRNQKLETNN